MGQSTSSGCSASHHFAPVLEEVEQRFEKLEKQLGKRKFVNYTFKTLKDYIQTFLVDFRFLIMFKDMVDKLSSRLWIELKSSLHKVESAINEIGKELLFAHHTNEVSKLVQLFSGLIEKIEVLKPLIEKSCKYLLEVEDQGCCWVKNDHWDGYALKCIQGNLQTLAEKADFQLDHHVQGQIKCLLQKLNSLTIFLVTESMHQTRESDLNALGIHAGAVTVRAANLSCLCWLSVRSSELDPSTAQGITGAFSRLQHKLDPATSPELLDMILRLLEAKKSHSNRQSTIERFFVCLLDMQHNNVLRSEMVGLVRFFIEVREEHGKETEQLLPDVAAVVRQARSVEYSSSEGGVPDLVYSKLLPMIYLLTEELFSIRQLSYSRPGIKRNDDDDEYARYLWDTVEARVKLLQSHLEFLRVKLADRPQKNMQHWRLVVMLFEPVVEQLLSLKDSLNARRITNGEARNVLFKVLLRILVFKAEAYSMDLLNGDESLLVKHQIGALKSLVASMTNMPRKLIFMNLEKVHKDEILILTDIESVVREVVYLCHSFNGTVFTGGMMKECTHWLCDLTQKIKEVVERIDVPFPKIEFPKTNGLGFIGFLLIKLKGQSMRYGIGPLNCVKQQIDDILQNLTFLRSSIMKQDAKYQECKDAAYMVEFIIDSILLGNGSRWHNFSWLYRVSENIRHIRILQETECQEKTCNLEVTNAAQAVVRQISQTSTFEVNEDVVVLNDQQQMIVDRLTRGSSQREIVSIVGMPGIGKTTLANQVYYDPKVVYYFHIRAWCCVSQAYAKRDLLLGILQQIIELTDSILTMPNEDLEFMLYKQLKGKRYLITMDDLWNIGAWDDLKSSFPDDGNGSRIMITSRLEDMVLNFSLESNLLNLRPLSDGESWELLKMKIFPKEICPEELLQVGKEIARSCKGLPLSLVAIAGLLQKTDMKSDSWKKIAERSNAIIVNDPQTRCMDILELSYEHLPDYLKPCFLFFAMFQEDKEIPVRRLIWLWMAEGFIERKDSKSIEDLALDYLRDLVGRSLITVSKRRSNGGVKACRIHDMVRNVCLSKAKEEKFLGLVTGDDEPYSFFYDSDDFDDFDPSNSITYKEHRLCISVSRQQFVNSRPSGPYVRSLQFFATTDAYPRCPYNVSFISKNFKLLKVLDLEAINMGSSFADGIDSLIQLIFLAVGGDIDSIPSSLANLRNLETLLVKGLKGKKVLLPESIWRMTSLRHVHVKNNASFTLQPKVTGIGFQLKNLVSLSVPSLIFGEDADEMIRMLPNLRELSCIFSKSRGSRDYYQFPRLEKLTQLESLKIVYRGRTIKTSPFNFPLGLKKLTLINFFLRWDHISTIGSLENLEILKLLSSTFEDTRWEMKEGEFHKLKYLKLDSPNIVNWVASCDDLPNLQQLVLQKCENLKEVPIDFVRIPTLQLIEVQRCGDSVEEAIRRLQQEQFEYGIEDLKVLINH
ncbi:unnamed protein product [Coffea canephora]|uniref:Uncharacterized protein n=1 Tax=Coffea canephora TaxID=49390 RepID=A0A068UTL6_COFCA|nr:unnamed protein product [Coffea canephora]